MATNNNNIKNRIAWLLLLILALLLGLSVVQQMGWLKIRNLQVMAIYLLIFLVPTLVYVKLRNKKCRSAMRLNPVSPRHWPAVLVVSVALCLICGVLNIVGYMVFQTISASDHPTSMLTFSSPNIVVLSLTMVILPAVTEEVLIRGVALGEYEQYGTGRAVLLTSLIFALFHANPIHFLSLFVAGVSYAMLTLLFDSIYPALAAHLLNNAVALLLYYYKDYFTYILGDAIFLIFAIIAVFLILIAALKLLEGVIDQRAARGKLRYMQARTPKSPYTSVPLILFAVGCIAKMVWTYWF